MSTPAQKIEGSPSFKVEIENGVATLLMDIPGEPVNTLSPEVGEEFRHLMEQLDKDPAVKALVLASGKKDGFIAGAKIEMLQGVHTAADAERLSRNGQEGFNQLAKLAKPVVVAIHGACLGGGLEWALACTYRIASDHKKTQLGLPEVQLGLLPGAGGTQRLPKLIGIADALDLIMSGRSLKAKKARAMGLVDEVVPAPILLAIAKKRALELANGTLHHEAPVHGVGKIRKGGFRAVDRKALQEAALEGNLLGREVLFRQAKAQVLKKTKGHYPAPLAALDAVRAGVEGGMEKGLAREAKNFGELVVSDVSRHLMQLFFAHTELKKDPGVDEKNVKPREVKKLGVLGGGLMGGGIAYVTIGAGVPTRVKDKDDAGVGRGFAYVRGLFDERVKRRSLTGLERDATMRLLTGGTDMSGFGTVDMVIEAVFEDLALKQKILQDFEAVNSRGIFASNTSTIPITKIASVSKHPETVLGMHYFSPVHKMPLLEIIVTAKTAPEVTATAVAVGKKQGKTVIVVKDGVGFYTSRILSPYMNEAAFLLVEGAAIEELDAALTDFGFPVGPITLLDEVGIDVAAKAGKIVHEAFGARMAAPAALERLIADGRMGRKNKKGFYVYAEEEGKKKKGKKEVDTTVYALLPEKGCKKMDRKEMAERVALQMVNEAILCLGEGILRSPRDGDIGAIFGLGFPPFLGGPFRYADEVGTRTLFERMERLRQKHGERFAPAPLLAEYAKGNKKFYA
jgi:3-hydroxyacyl-CoA dehydrogenase/enoyl-CoA hydratase/3-hydroxybutyryl-CoA epimerase